MIQRRLFVSIQSDMDLLRDGARYPILEHQCVQDLPFITLSPDVLIGGYLDQPRRDPNLVPGTQHASFHHGIYVQLAGIWASGLRTPLYVITEVREITRNALICPSLAINRSVMPS